LILQPEGVAITADDLRPPFGAGNALASALRTARDHLIRLHPGEGASRDTEPYPLLLVRPEGLNMFGRARRAIEAGDFDFGFELVESDWDLKYPAPDYKLAELEHSAIEQARVRQQILAEAAPRAYRNPSLASAGEFEYDDEQIASPGPGRNVYVMRRKEPRGGNGLGDMNQDDSADADGGNGGGESGSGDGGRGDGTGTGNGSASGGGGGSGAMASGSPNGGYPGGPASSGTSVPNTLTQGSGPDGVNGTGGSAAMAGTAQGGNPISGSGGGSAFGTERPENNGSEIPQRTDFADARATQPGMYQDPGDSRHTRDNHRDQQADDEEDAKIDPAATRGKDWALRNKPGRAVPVRRTIHVVVHDDQLIIVPDEAPIQNDRPAGKIVPIQGDTVQSLDAFVTEIRETIDDWGIAGENLYWRPVLVLTVAPDGQKRTADLSRLLKNSGLELSTGEVANKNPQRNTQ
jgi:hypothetical protein